MALEGTKIDRVIYDAHKRRFEADVFFDGVSAKRVHVSIPGHISWAHDRMVNAIVSAAHQAG